MPAVQRELDAACAFAVRARVAGARVGPMCSGHPTPSPGRCHADELVGTAGGRWEWLIAATGWFVGGLVASCDPQGRC